MIALGMIMRQILLDDIGQRPLAQQEHLRQGFLLDRAHEPFAVGVQIWAPGWQDDGLYTTLLQQSIERLGELRSLAKITLPFIRLM
jgi:hypothetical protein